MNNTIENEYNQLAIQAMINKANERKISNYIMNFYNSCKDKLNGMSLEEFAAYTSNYNVNKSNIGEKCQITYLRKNKFPSIKPLPNKGKDSISLQLDFDDSIFINNGKTNLVGIKSFDAIADNKLFILKCIDFGEFSESIGGGHQDNVKNEIKNIINIIGDQKLYFNNNEMEILILINGRLSQNIIDDGKKLIMTNSSITINSCEGI